MHGLYSYAVTTDHDTNVGTASHHLDCDTRHDAVAAASEVTNDLNSTLNRDEFRDGREREYGSPMSIVLGWMRYATRLFRPKPTLGKQVGKFRQPDAVSSKGQVEATPSDLQMIMKSLAQSLRVMIWWSKRCRGPRLAAIGFRYADISKCCGLMTGHWMRSLISCLVARYVCTGARYPRRVAAAGTFQWKASTACMPGCERLL